MKRRVPSIQPVRESGQVRADTGWGREHGLGAERHDPAFPKGANVNYYTRVSDTEVNVLTFERGVEDFTLACGTGCGSVATVLYLWGRLPGKKLRLENRGGVLDVTIQADTQVEALYQEGPTEIVKIFDLDI